MSTRKAVRADLANVIFTNAGVRTVGFAADSIPAPCATVWFQPMDPRLVFTELKSAYLLTVRLWAPRTAERANQDLLDDWCEMTGSSSVIAAIQDTSHWSQTIDYAIVTNIGDVQETARGEAVFLTVDLDVEVVW